MGRKAKLKIKAAPTYPETLWTVFAAIWLALFPLWQDGSYSHLTRAKWIGMLVLTGFTILAALLCFFRMGKEKLPFRFVWTPAHTFAGAYFFWVLLSAFLGSWADSVNDQGLPVVWFGALRYEGTLTQLCYGILFLILSQLPVKKQPWLDAVSAALLFYCIIVVIQYTGGNPFGLFPATMGFPTTYKFQGTMGNTNMVSAYLSLVIPLLSFAYVQDGRKIWLVSALWGTLLMSSLAVQSGILALGALILLLLILLLCMPQYRIRAGLTITGLVAMVLLRQVIRLPWFDGGKTLGLIPARVWMPAVWLLFGSAMLKLLGRWKGSVRLRTVLLVLVMLGILAIVAIALLPIPKKAQGLWELHRIFQGKAKDSFGSGRLGMWRYTLDLCRESPLFGTGPDTFYYAMGNYLAENSIQLKQAFDTPHNSFLAIAVGSGWPALILYFFLICAALLRIRQQPQAFSLAAAVCCYLVQSFFTFSICLVSPMFFALLGILCGPGYKMPEERS